LLDRIERGGALADLARQRQETAGGLHFRAYALNPGRLWQE
jgi:hypothetical protein